jgi:hypothetical protein
LILFDEARSESDLVSRGLVFHVENFFTWPDITLGMAVAIQTPLHQERFFLPNQWHSVDPTVAGGTAHSLVHMDTVVEISEIGQVMNSGPSDGLV